MSTSNTSNMNLNLNYNMDEAKFIINEKFNTTNAYKLLKINNLLDTEAANKLKKYLGLAKDGEVKVEYTVNSIGPVGGRGCSGSAPGPGLRAGRRSRRAARRWRSAWWGASGTQPDARGALPGRDLYAPTPTQSYPAALRSRHKPLD